MSRFLFLVALVVPVLLAACGGDDAPRRTIGITQTDDACIPQRPVVTPRERITFAVTNDGKKDREVEGIEGMKFEEVLVPSGRTRNIDWTAPSNQGVQKLKCYVPGGSTVIVEVNVIDPKETVTASLIEYSITADKSFVAAGAIRFVGRNTSQSQIHELAILRPKADGSFENLGEVENIAPGKSGDILLDLPVGKYVFACLIAPGEAGSTVDHFKQGMRLDFEVK
jgi:uncharacterized cupredoxin-like copper-binding protein